MKGGVKLYVSVWFQLGCTLFFLACNRDTLKE